MLYSSDLIIPHQVLCGIAHTAVRCLGRLDYVIALSFHRLGCCHMKCCVLYIHLVVISWKYSVSMDLVVFYFFFLKFCFRRLGFFLTGNSISVDLVVILRKKFTFVNLIVIL